VPISWGFRFNIKKDEQASFYERRISAGIAKQIKIKMRIKIKSHAIAASALGTVAPARYLSLPRHRQLLLSFIIKMKMKIKSLGPDSVPLYSIKLKIALKIKS